MQYAVCGISNRLRCSETLPVSSDHERSESAIFENDMNQRILVMSSWEDSIIICEKAIIIKENNITLKEQAITAMEKNGERLLCKICLEFDSNVLFIPCMHICVCRQCYVCVNMCPICGEIIQTSRLVYICYTELLNINLLSSLTFYADYFVLQT